jgi:hypothetical protein
MLFADARILISWWQRCGAKLPTDHQRLLIFFIFDGEVCFGPELILKY